MTSAFTPSEIESYFHKKIPLTQAMGIRVEGFNREHLILRAPLEANHNHLGTAFGGSLSAVATLAGYGLLWLELGDRDSHVVIRESRISFLRPVRGEIRAICNRPEKMQLDEFHERFRLTGKARIQLAVTIEDGGETAVDFVGIYVALR